MVGLPGFDVTGSKRHAVVNARLKRKKNLLPVNFPFKLASMLQAASQHIDRPRTSQYAAHSRLSNVPRAMPSRLTLAAVVVAAASALVPPTKPLQQRQPSTRPIAAARPAAVAVATALIPTVAPADFGSAGSWPGTQDYVAMSSPLAIL